MQRASTHARIYKATEAYTLFHIASAGLPLYFIDSASQLGHTEPCASSGSSPGAQESKHIAQSLFCCWCSFPSTLESTPASGSAATYLGRVWAASGPWAARAQAHGVPSSLNT